MDDDTRVQVFEAITQSKQLAQPNANKLQDWAYHYWESNSLRLNVVHHENSVNGVETYI